MSRSLKSILFAAAGLIGLIIISVTLLLFIDVNAYKPQLESAASEALGMEVRVGGRLGVALFPGVHVRLHDVRVRNRGMEIASADEAGLELAFFPLLRREIRIEKIRLQRPRISITRERDGKFNFEKREEAKGTLPALSFDHLSLSDGSFLYEDEHSGGEFKAESFNLDVYRLRIAEGKGAELLKRLSFTAEFTGREIRTAGFAFSNVRFTCKGGDGGFVLNPLKMRFLGGQASGSIGAGFSGPVPHYTVRSTLVKFRIEEYFKTLSAKKVAEGAMDFTASLSMRGNTVKELTRTAEGEVSLRGDNLTLYGYDLDREFERFESSQSFNLVDAGAFFFAGPIGLAVTKGYNFAGILTGSGGGSSGIGKIFSDWKVERGIAEARDVAMATRQNRIALKGRIDFVDERFDDMTMALIDARGCARVKQKIHGPLRKPVVEKPNVLMSLAGPALNLLKQARDLIAGDTCELFYAGSVPAPK